MSLLPLLFSNHTYTQPYQTIDWEYPAYEDHSGTPDDTVNFTKLLATIRAKLDDLGAATGRFYGLTAGKSFKESGIDMFSTHLVHILCTRRLYASLLDTSYAHTSCLSLYPLPLSSTYTIQLFPVVQTRLIRSKLIKSSIT